MAVVNILNSLVSITQFNKGQATKIFDRLKTEKRLIVLKNNIPSAVILSTEEFERICEIEENYYLLLKANERLTKENLEKAVAESEVLYQVGITKEDINNAEDVEIE